MSTTHLLAAANSRKRNAEDTPADGAKLSLDAPDALDAVCLRIEGGDTLTEIAKDYGIHKSMLSRWMRTTDERRQRYDDARRLSAEALSEEAAENIASARTKLEAQKARDLAHHLRWMAKMRDPARFADRVAVTGEGGGPVAHSLTVSFK
jgi:transposase-like protein